MNTHSKTIRSKKRVGMLKSIKLQLLFPLLVLIFGSIFLLSTKYILDHQIYSDVNHIANEEIVNKSKERVDFTLSYFNPYVIYMEALEKKAVAYINNQRSEVQLSEDFVMAVDGLECLFQLRILDNEFNEIIKVNNTPFFMKKGEYDTRVYAKDELHNKAHRDYVQHFVKLNEHQIGFSYMSYHMENRNMTNKPALRIGFRLYKEGKPQGYLIGNICLREFLNKIRKMVLYHIELIDNRGLFLLHKNLDDSYLMNSQDRPKNSIQTDERFKQDALSILTSESHWSKNYYTIKVPFFNTDQSIRMILSNKFQAQSVEQLRINNLLLIGISLTLVFGLFLSFIFGIVADHARETMQNNYLFDEDTELGNRNKLLEDLKDNKQSVIALVYVDNIEKMLSVYGISNTDELLMKYAKRLEQVAKKYMFNELYRIDFATFGLTYDFDGDYEFLETMIQSVHHDIENEEISCGDGCAVIFSVTIGVSDPYTIKEGNEELIEAFLSLNVAKKGQTKTSILDKKSVLAHEYKDALVWTKRLKRAIKEKEVVPYFQPIVNADGTIEKYESLMRIEQDGEVYYPDNFLPIAKTSKLYNYLTREMIDKVFLQMSKSDKEFSINLSILDIICDDFLEYLMTKLEEYKVSDRLVVELVETEEFVNNDALESFILLMKSMNIKIAIDDFGSGYSNMENIVKLSSYIDYLKIDGSLIQNLPYDQNAQIITKHVVGFSKALGIQIVTEYVATQEILDSLTPYGIDYYQGYFYGRPEPILQDV
jgi:EAL domain-containing protein (putative c-di-GMP-specific phosphodiesterase class I)/GGDEF domain-containing protein